MRIAFSVIFSVFIAMLALCGFFAWRSKKSIGKAVFLLLLALIPPVVGNQIIIATDNQTIATVGCYIYFLGMDLVMFALIRFTIAYCLISKPKKWILAVVYSILIFDCVQLLLNIRFGHAFTTEGIMVEDSMYYKVVPFAGQTAHRVVDYSIFIAVVVIFLIKVIRSPRINSERYTVILATMIFTGIVQTFYIFSGTPVDWSMTGYGLFGFLVFYFSLYYRPLRLLDKMLAAIASEIPEALFFFDTSGRCIWANRPAKILCSFSDGNYEKMKEKLIEKFGEIDESKPYWTMTHVSGEGDEVQSYVLEKRTLNDRRGRAVGSFLSVRDNTDDQKTLQREIYNATHDSLTKVYNRAGYDLLVKGQDTTQMILLLIDIDDFKSVNDTYGHEAGDRVLRLIADKLVDNFGKYGHICRMGGDELLILFRDTSEKRIKSIENRIIKINDEISTGYGKIPKLSISAGAAVGAGDIIELFDHADQALYITKRRGKSGLTVYSEACEVIDSFL